MADTATRLAAYYNFSPEVIDTVAGFTEQQQRYATYAAFLGAVGAEQPQMVAFEGYSPVQMLDIRPTEYEEDRALVIHLPMANPLDPNNRYQVAAVAATNPDKRVIAAGCPSGRGYGYGLLTHAQRRQVASGDMRPVVEPVLKYLDTQGVERVWHQGASCGADKAVVAASAGAHKVDSLVVIEPASVVRRSFGHLAAAFATCGTPLKNYVQRSEMATFEAARKDSVNLVEYTAGLARLSNIAIARALTDGKFADRMTDALAERPEMKATIAWGSASELALDSVVDAMAKQLQQMHGEDRVQAIRLPGQRHALSDDIPLHAALILEGLR